MLVLSIALALAAGKALPDGTRLRPITQCFAITRGDKAIGATWQQIRSVRVGGRRAWDIVVHQRLTDGSFDLRDHFILSRDHLTPIAFDNQKSGKDHVRLTYVGRRIAGSRTEEGKVDAIDVPMPAQVWEGNLWGVTFGAMPLADGAKLSLPFYQYDSGFGSFTLAVTGSETVATPGGPVAAWIVDAGTDPKRRVTYLIDKRTGKELGTRGPGFGTRLGGDCAGLK